MIRDPHEGRRIARFIDYVEDIGKDGEHGNVYKALRDWTEGEGINSLVNLIATLFSPTDKFDRILHVTGIQALKWCIENVELRSGLNTVYGSFDIYVLIEEIYIHTKQADRKRLVFRVSESDPHFRLTQVCCLESEPNQGNVYPAPLVG